MALAIDVNTVITGSGVSLTTNAFSTISANELLLAFIGCEQNSAVVSSVSDTSGLTWVKVKSSNTSVFSDIEVWRAFATTTLSSDTFTANASTGRLAFINVITFTGTDKTGTNGSGAIGATNSTGYTSPADPSLSITTTQNNSWVFAAGSLAGSGSLSAPVAGSNQSILQSFTDNSNFYALWSQNQNATTPTSGTSVTMSAIEHNATNNGDFIVVEILPDTSSPATLGFSVSNTSYRFIDRVIGY